MAPLTVKNWFLIRKSFTNWKVKVKVKYVDLYSASSRSASNVLPFPVSRRWSLQANPTARHQRTLRDHVIRVGAPRDMQISGIALWATLYDASLFFEPPCMKRVCSWLCGYMTGRVVTSIFMASVKRARTVNTLTKSWLMKRGHCLLRYRSLLCLVK